MKAKDKKEKTDDQRAAKVSLCPLVARLVTHVAYPFSKLSLSVGNKLSVQKRLLLQTRTPPNQLQKIRKRRRKSRLQ